MPKPILKQFGDLKPEDFGDYSIWVNCHTLDYDEAWYDDTDEETFRPWVGDKPVSSDEMYLVSARFTFADGSFFSGFVTPKYGEEPFTVSDLGTIQPNVFSTSGERLSFWFGMFGSPESILKFYSSFEKSAAQVFPIKFEALPGLTTALAAGHIPGFCTTDGKVTLTA